MKGNYRLTVHLDNVKRASAATGKKTKNAKGKMVSETKKAEPCRFEFSTETCRSAMMDGWVDGSIGRTWKAGGRGPGAQQC